MITFVADLHLSLNNRINDFEKVLIEQVLPTANQSIKFYIVGDIFHDRRPHPVEMNIFRHFISQVKVPTIIVLGNHDENLSASTLDEFKYWNTNIRVIQPPFIETVGKVTIYLDHAQYEGAKLGPSNLNLNIKEAKKIKNLPTSVDGRTIDYYVFGHVHKAQMLRENPPTLYVGSIEHIDFAERNEDKFMFQIDEATKKYGYKKLETRPMYQLKVELPTSGVFKFSTQPVRNAIVKVVVEGTKEQLTKFNEALLLEYLKESYKFSIVYNVIKENKVTSTFISEEKTIVECFKDFANLKKFTAMEIQKGIAIINEC